MDIAAGKFFIASLGKNAVCIYGGTLGALYVLGLTMPKKY